MASACAAHSKRNEGFNLATRKGSETVVNNDMTAEVAIAKHTVVLQALEIVRNSPEGNGAEVWRKLLWEYEPGFGIRYGAMLQSLLKRRFGEHDETDLAREIESFERDISKYEHHPSDLISVAIKHGIVCGGMVHQGLKQHIDLSISRLATYKSLQDEIIHYCRARGTWTDPNAMQVDAVMLTSTRNGSSLRSDKGKGGKGGKGKSKKGGKGKQKDEQFASKFEGQCRYCQKKGHKKAEGRKMNEDLDAGKCDKNGKHQVPSRKRAVHRVWRAPSQCSRWFLCTARIPLAVRRLSRQKPGSST